MLNGLLCVRAYGLPLYVHSYHILLSFWRKRCHSRGNCAAFIATSYLNETVISSPFF